MFQSSCTDVGSGFHLPLPSSLLEARVLVDKARKRIGGNNEFLIPVGVHSYIDDEFSLEAKNPTTDKPINWGRWTREDSVNQYKKG